MSAPKFSALFLLAGAFSAYAQNGSVLTGLGGFPSLPIAPGQIVKLQVFGLQYLSADGSYQASAEGLPLPTSLAGLSVRIGENLAPFNSLTYFPMPLVSVEQVPTCSPLLSECSLTILTVQIPFELVVGPPCPSCLVRPIRPIIVTQNGKDSGMFSFASLVQDAIHIVTGCDVAPRPSCLPIVTHSDGSAVYADSPAKPGETVVVYAYGLGQTIPSVKTGVVTPSIAPIVSGGITVDFDFRPNASPSATIPAPAGNSVIPAFAGLTPGQVGLYQVNVRLPDTFPAVARCDPSPTSTSSGDAKFSIQSNLTINVGGVSFDGAPICVTPDR